MKDRYEQYRENFIKLVEAENAKPNIFKGAPQELIPDDCDEYVSNYLKAIRNRNNTTDKQD